MAKTLELANVKLGSVVSDIMGVTGRAILKAMIEGEEGRSWPDAASARSSRKWFPA